MPNNNFRAPYPYVDCTDAELIIDLSEVWKKLLDDVANSRNTLLIENFIFRAGMAGDAMVDAMVRAANNGAVVRLMVDSYGSSTLSDNMRHRFDEAGIKIQVYNPARLRDLFTRGSKALPRTHRRLVVCDEEVAWIGGLAIDDQWWPESERVTARDTMLRFGGEAVSHIIDCFERLWSGVGAGPKLKRYPEATDGQLRVIPQYAFRRPNYRRTFHWHLHAAKQRAWIAVPYFIPGPRLMSDLRIVAQRGIDLRFLFPGEHTDHPNVRLAARRYYGRLLRAGARVYEYQPSFMHAKLSIFDDDHLIVGSSNLDRWSLFINNELVAACKSQSLNQTASQQFLADLENSNEITLDEWQRRSIKQRVLERWFGLFDKAF